MQAFSLPTAFRGREKFFLDLTVWSLAGLLAFFVRIDLPWLEHKRAIVLYLALGLIPKALIVYVFGLHRQSWHKVGVRDAYLVARAIAVFTVPVYLLNFVLFDWTRVPRSVPLIDGALAFLALGGMRLLARVLFEREGIRATAGSSRRILVIGAGEAGTMMVRELLRHPESGLVPVGFLDDEPVKRSQQFLGLPVLGVVDALPRVASEQSIDEVLIAMPSAPGRIVRRVVDLARGANLRYRIIPGIHEILSGQVALSQIRDVSLEDLLRREPVRLETNAIAGYLEGRTVLVTGAGGSIGSEIVRQVSRFKPRKLILLGRGENSIFTIEQELKRTWPELEYALVIGDVRDRTKLEDVFRRFSPHVVFHAAAHKHVYLMEHNPDEAILNNVFGTKNLVDLCLEHGVERLVNISTDKAVNPTSVMGASKRVAEYIVESGARRAEAGQTFSSVRFGNVLGSRGSVIPKFQQQIRDGGPVTVTDPAMIRYFMLIPEAAQLVLQAGGLPENGAVYVLDMGEPVKIVDLARDVIRLSGFEVGKDIEIVFTGAQPGEKLYEELLTSDEGTQASKYEKIFVAKQGSMSDDQLEAALGQLETLARGRDTSGIRQFLLELIPGARLKSDSLL
jgi:FlaA1/EpsC-like NDP-sugar epimerase